MNSFTNSNELDQRIAASLAARRASSASYTAEEIQEIETLDTRLFPKGFELDLRATKEFRLLCQTSQVTINRPTALSSHRRYIGPAIVFLKKVTWPLVQIHLKQTLTSMSEFNAQVVRQLARQHVAQSQR